MKQLIIVCGIFFSISAYAQNSLVACFPFNGNANDASGNNNHCVVSGATLASDRFNNSNSSYYFNGISDIMTFSPINFFLNEFTYSVWCKPVSIPTSGNYGSILSIGGSVNDQVILIGNQSSLGNIGFACGTWGQGNFAHCYVGTQPSINDWHHIVFTRNNVVMKMFVDGQLICSSPTSANASYSGSLINGSIGARGQSGVQTFAGLIDDITIYNIAVTDSQALILSSTCSNVGLQTNNQNSINAYYNSVNHSLDFSTIGLNNSFNINFQLSLYNPIGQEILKSELILNESPAKTSYAIPDNLSGLHILTIRKNNEAILTRKILIY